MVPCPSIPNENRDLLFGPSFFGGQIFLAELRGVDWQLVFSLVESAPLCGLFLVIAFPLVYLGLT